jgi:hypothetical protein
MRNIKYGGTLVPGDFIAVSYQNHIDLGWYAGDGRGTLQYYTLRGPGIAYKDYQDWLNSSDEEKRKNKWMSSRFEKGFTRKSFWKSYINSVHSTRVMKLTNPEEIFTEKEDRESYEKSKEALITINFIKQ